MAITYYWLGWSCLVNPATAEIMTMSMSGAAEVNAAVEAAELVSTNGVALLLASACSICSRSSNCSKTTSTSLPAPW